MKALVLEDDQKLARFLARVLSEEGFTVDVCALGADAVAQAESGLYDLIVLDRTVPDMDGLAVCQEIRRTGGTVPILMLTARAATGDRIAGLEAGADQYVVKPFEVEELLARIHALLRRTTTFSPLRCGDLEVDPTARRARLAGRALDLTNRELSLLSYLLQRAGEVVEREELLKHVWGGDPHAVPSLVKFHVSRLRDKLGDHARMIETVRGVGYRLRRDA